MDEVDLNLLVPLDVLLEEGSVTGAARRLGLSASAMGRTLIPGDRKADWYARGVGGVAAREIKGISAGRQLVEESNIRPAGMTRLRFATGDPLLVRAGRGLVSTPRRVELRDRVHALTREAKAVLRPQPGQVDVASLERTFAIRASEGFLEVLSTLVVAAVAKTAPHVRLHFLAKPDRDARPLRDGTVDLEVGAQAPSAPEVRMQLLFRDRFVGVARHGHPVLSEAEITPQRYAALHHVAASREGEASEAIEGALGRLGLSRTVMVVVPGYPDAMRIARQSDLLALVPRSCVCSGPNGNEAADPGIIVFELPIKMRGFAVSAMWHPRLDADLGHRWLREMVMSVCREAYPERRCLVASVAIARTSSADRPLATRSRCPEAPMSQVPSRDNAEPRDQRTAAATSQNSAQSC